MGHRWTKLDKIKWIANLENVGLTFLQVLTQFVSKCLVHSWKIILVFFVAVILQMKESFSASLTFRTHN